MYSHILHIHACQHPPLYPRRMPDGLSQLFKDKTTSLFDTLATGCLRDGVHADDEVGNRLVAFSVWNVVPIRVKDPKSRRKSDGKHRQSITLTIELTKTRRKCIW